MKRQDRGYYLPHLTAYILAKLIALPSTFSPDLLKVGKNGPALASRLVSDGLAMAAGTSYKVLEPALVAAAKRASAAQLGFDDILRNNACWHILCALPQNQPNPKLSRLAGLADERMRYTANPLIRNRVIERTAYWNVDWGPGASQELKDLVLAFRDMLANRGPPHPGSLCIYQRGLEAAWLTSWSALKAWGVPNAVPRAAPIAFLGGGGLDVIDALFMAARAKAKLGWKQESAQSQAVVHFLVRYLDQESLGDRSLRGRFSFYGFAAVWPEVAEALAEKRGRSGLRPLSSRRYFGWPGWDGPRRFGDLVVLPFRRDLAFNRLARSSSR